MVVLGSWPYKYTISLDKIHSDTKIRYTYLVDKDKIVARDDVPDEYIVEENLYVAMSQEMETYISKYQEQLFPPDIPEEIQETLGNGRFSDMMDKVVNSGALLVVNNNRSSIMEGIGAKWNEELGLWIVSSDHLDTIKREKKEKFEGRILHEPYLDTMVKIWGDTHPHVDLLHEHGAEYRADEDAWYLPISKFDIIADELL